jgi:hydrogenase maturation protease
VTLVIGLGSADRGDDAVGLVVCAALEGEPGVRVRALADASLLPAIWGDEDDVVVVDAVRDPSRVPGDLLVVPLAPGTALPQEGSTHGFDLAAAVELAAAVGRLPGRLVLVGVVGATFGLGEPMDARVAAAVPAAAGAVRGARGSGPAPSR